MKKFFYSAVALATLLFAGSCQQEKFETAEGSGTVTFTVEAPGALASKALAAGQVIADGTNVNVVHYAVYKPGTTGEYALENESATPLAQGFVPMDNKTATITFDLLKNQDYVVIFWAQVDGAGHYELGDLRNITLNTTVNSEGVHEVDGNDETRAAFYRTYPFSTNEKLHEVKLYRPFAQLNLLTTEASLTPQQPGQTSSYTIDVLQSEVSVKGLSTTFNTVSGLAPVGTEEITFVLKDTPAVQGQETLKVNDVDYHYVSMNYFFVPEDEEIVEVSYSLTTDPGENAISNTILNVPVKENYRTNIIGNLLTTATTFEIIVDEMFNVDGKENTVVIEDGLVLNINGDYEVSTANGLAYAINNLFVKGGNFYLTSDLYEMSGYSVNPPVIDGVTININGQMPVITRSSVSGSVTITGLSGSLIDIIENSANVVITNVDLKGNNVSFVNENKGTLTVTDANITGDGASVVVSNTGSVYISNTNVEGDGTCLVKDNDGKATITDSQADTLIAEGSGDAELIKTIYTFDEFTANLSSVTTLRLGADITYTKNYILSQNVNIDLNGYSFEISDPALALNISSTSVVKNGTIKGKVYARTGSKITFDGVTFGGSINGGGSTEGLLQIQGACEVYAKDCKFNATNSNTTKSRPLSIQATSSGTYKFENCEFKSNLNQNQVYVNSLSGTATVDFTNCNFNNKTPNIMLAASCPFTSLTMSGTTKLSSVTLEINRAKTAVTEDDLAYLRTLISNNSFSSVRVFYAGGSSEYIR